MPPAISILDRLKASNSHHSISLLGNCRGMFLFYKRSHFVRIRFALPLHGSPKSSKYQVLLEKSFPAKRRTKNQETKRMDYIPIYCYSIGRSNAVEDDSPIHGDCTMLLLLEEEDEKTNTGMGMGLINHGTETDGCKINRNRDADFKIQRVQKIKNSDLEEIRQIGSGSYGIVYFGRWKGSEVAIKRMRSNCFQGDKHEKDVKDFWKEATLQSQLHHPNVVSFYGVVTDGPLNSLAMVTEYMINGSLKQVLQKKDRTIDRRKRIMIAMDAALGMDYLHEKNIIHFDLKSHNLLVNVRDPQRPVCKIGDFGLAKMMQNANVSAGARGTLPWMAPELLKSNKNLVTEKVDVFSFGIVMWELLTGESPYAGMSADEIIAGVIMGYLRPEIPHWCDPAWRSLMTRCWSTHRPMRPTFTEIARELQTIAVAMNIQLDSFRTVEYQEAGRCVQLDKMRGRDEYSRPYYRCAEGQNTHANVFSNSAFRCA